jgi:hypothetical protein
LFAVIKLYQQAKAKQSGCDFDTTNVWQDTDITAHNPKDFQAGIGFEQESGRWFHFVVRL